MELTEDPITCQHFLFLLDNEGARYLFFQEIWETLAANKLQAHLTSNPFSNVPHASLPFRPAILDQASAVLNNPAYIQNPLSGAQVLSAIIRRAVADSFLSFLMKTPSGITTETPIQRSLPPDCVKVSGSSASDSNFTDADLSVDQSHVINDWIDEVTPISLPFHSHFTLTNSTNRVFMYV
jgi:hypothetical protein